MIYSGYDTVEGPCKDALHISKPAADGALVAGMEGLLMGHAISEIEIGPLEIEQQRLADDYRVVEKIVRDLHRSLSTKGFDIAGRAATEASIVIGTAELMRLGEVLLDC